MEDEQDKDKDQDQDQDQKQPLPEYVAALIERAKKAEAERDAARAETAERDSIIKRLLDGEEKAPSGDFQKMLRI